MLSTVSGARAAARARRRLRSALRSSGVPTIVASDGGGESWIEGGRGRRTGGGGGVDRRPGGGADARVSEGGDITIDGADTTIEGGAIDGGLSDGRRCSRSAAALSMRAFERASSRVKRRARPPVPG